MEEISFPLNEIESIKNTLDKYGFCSTTRVAEEFYKIKQYRTYVNRQGLGKLYISKTRIYENIKDHPYYKNIAKHKDWYDTITKYMKKSENKFKVAWFEYA
jgi:hypothetical protein